MRQALLGILLSSVKNEISISRILNKLMGAPQQNSSGVIAWRNIEVGNLGKVPLVKLADGIMTYDEEVSSSCFVPFKNIKGRQLKLSELKSNQSRNMRIAFCEKEECIIRSADKEKLYRDFLTSAIKK